MNRHILLEEIFNSITHGIGFLLTIVGLVVFFITQVSISDVWRIVGFSIFIGSLLCMYLFSTLSHSLVFTKARNIFAILDYSSIFLLIAGTYTYFLLTVLRGVEGWSLLSVIWVLSFAGIVLKVFLVNRLKILTVAMYLFLGWLCLVVVKPLLHVITMRIFLLLLFGGIFYTLGTIFYSSRKIPFSHSIWHVFVICATACHFLAIYLL